MLRSFGSIWWASLRVLAGLLLSSTAAPAFAAICSQATSQGTAPATWQTYCWLDFSSYNDTTAKSASGQNFSITLSDGATLTFNVKTTGTPGVIAKTAPSWTGAAVGNTAFLGIPGQPILYQQAGGTNVITISNILITPAPGVPAVSAYMFVAADAESTNNGESLAFNTNGGTWTILDQVNPISGSLYPTIAGTGTATFTETGVAGTVGGYIVGSNSPTTVTTTLVGGGLQGAMFAVRFASIRLNKQIGGGRVNPADQFKFDIAATSGGTILGTGTSTGTGNGPFTAAAVSLASGIPLTLTEAMASGSVSAMAEYRSSLTCTNSTTGSSTPLPTAVITTSYNFGTLQFGDSIQCSFTNTAYPHLRVQKALGDTRLFDTNQFTVNLKNGATVLASSTTTGTGATVTAGTGQTPMTQVTAGASYSMDESAAGTTALLQYTATMSCSNVATGSTTTLPTTMPGTVTPQMGDVITCTITNTKKANNANLTMIKSSQILSDPVNGTVNPKAIPGAEVIYSIMVANTGTLSVDSSTIFLLDPIPATTTYNNGITVSYVASTTPSPGSSFTFTPSSDVRFSNSTTGAPANFAACTYTPTAGYDANVKYLCVRPQGPMGGATSAGQSSFTISFRAKVN